MTTKHYLLILTLLCGLCWNQLPAQNLSFEDVTEIRLQDMAPIYQNGVVKGYFAFYYIDKAEKKTMSNFKLILLDENLNKISEKKIVGQKDVQLKMAAYDGVSLLFVFHNEKKDKLEFRRYDLQLNELSSEVRFMSAIENALMTSGGNQQAPPPHIVSVEGKGFIFYNFLGWTGGDYKMQYFPEKGTAWDRKTGPKDRAKLLPDALCNNDKLLLQHFTEWGTPSKYLQAVSLETGKVVFDKEMLVEKYAVQVFHAYPDSVGNFVVVGQYYEDDDNILKGKSLGVFVGKINGQGNFISHQYLSWKKDISQKVKVDENNRINDKGYVFFRDAVHTKDGKIYLAGELYDLAGSAVGRGVEIKDFIVLEINPNGSLNDVKLIEKKSDVLNINGIPLTKNPEKLANYVRMYGGFDYLYTQLDDDENAFTFFYATAEKKEKGKDPEIKLTAVSKHVGDKSYETDVIPLDSKADYHRVLPAKAGHLLFVEYFEKTRKLDMRIEKFNY